jgi:hypothetical protein
MRAHVSASRELVEMVRVFATAGSVCLDRMFAF